VYIKISSATDRSSFIGFSKTAKSLPKTTGSTTQFWAKIGTSWL